MQEKEQEQEQHRLSKLKGVYPAAQDGLKRIGDEINLALINVREIEKNYPQYEDKTHSLRQQIDKMVMWIRQTAQRLDSAMRQLTPPVTEKMSAQPVALPET